MKTNAMIRIHREEFMGSAGPVHADRHHSISNFNFFSN